MKRRSFIKSLGAVGASALLPSTLPTAFNMSTMYKAANAAIDYAGAQITPPAIMPQVINVFLYGGPSELSGNLTNIVDINNNSQNPYDAKKIKEAHKYLIIYLKSKFYIHLFIIKIK